jgi:hypothetical protein
MDLKMKVTETKYIEEGGYFRIKVDIETDKEKVIGFKVLTHSKKIECELEKGKIKTLKTDLIDFDEKQTLLKDEYINVGRKWDDDQTDLLIEKFYYTKGNLELISKEMKRGIKGITMKCIQLGLIDKD